MQLTAKKYRDRLGLYLIEGENLLREAIKNGVRIEYIIFAESAYERLLTVFTDVEGEPLDAGHGRKSPETVIMNDKLFMNIAQTETPQGVLAVVGKPDISRKSFIESITGSCDCCNSGKTAGTGRESGNVVVLDRLQDPGNIGTIIRTADAAGYGGIVLLKGTADIFSPKVIRAAAGSVFRMPIFFAEDPQEVLALMKECGKKTAATCFETENYYYQTDITKDTALIIGNEGNGICREFTEGADIKVKIPMYGNIESLNAAVAAAILMYEAVREKGEM